MKEKMKEKLEELKKRKKELDKVMQNVDDETTCLAKEFYNAFIQVTGENNFVPVFGEDILVWIQDDTSLNRLRNIGVECPLLTIASESGAKQVFTIYHEETLQRLYNCHKMIIKVRSVNRSTPKHLQKLWKIEGKLIRCFGFYKPYFREEEIQKLVEAGNVVEIFDAINHRDQVFTPVGCFQRKKGK